MCLCNICYGKKQQHRTGEFSTTLLLRCGKSEKALEIFQVRKNPVAKRSWWFDTLQKTMIR